jgi:membrane-bound lytic murein transglycosylase A
MINKILTLIILSLSLALGSCIHSKIIITGKNNIKLTQIDFSEIKGWKNDHQKQVLTSFINSCKKFLDMDPDQLIGNSINIKAKDFYDICDIAAEINHLDQTGSNISDAQIRNFFENWFTAFLVADANGNSKGKFTGYYEPELRGSKVKNNIYQYPIYLKPQDLGNQHYFTRKEIADGALDGKNLELLYVDDKVELFFLHIQGSGIITLPDGDQIKVSYSASNNQPYSSIGSYLAKNINQGDISLSAIGIKNWLKNNTQLADEVMNNNDSYIFFKISKTQDIVGAFEIPLIKERSLAIDNKIMPYGFPIFVSIRNTDIKNPGQNFQKLMIASDTGSAIKGTIRGDIFFGRGSKAEEKASTMNAIGQYYILLPNQAVNRMINKNILK